MKLTYEREEQIDMSKVRTIYSVIGIGCMVLVVVSVLLSCTSTRRMEGIINYQEDKVEIVFPETAREIGVPDSLKSDDEYFVSYAKLHDGERIECDVQIITFIELRIYYLKKVYFE